MAADSEESMALDESKGDETKETKAPETRISKTDLAQACTLAQTGDWCHEVVRAVICEWLDGRTYQAAQVPRWVDAVNESVLDQLSSTCDNLKYIVSTVIFERSKGAGLHFEATMFWDPAADSSVNVAWENDEIGCIVTVFGLAL